MTHKRGYLRFPLKYRLEHWVLFLTFTALAVTGLVQKYAQADLSIRLIELLGGIASIRSIHRIAATMMMIETIYHFGQIVYNLRVRRHNPELMLTRTDFRNAWQALKYNLGRSSEHPRQGRYTFEEKFEYFALIWGTIVMIVTGFVLWNPIAATAVLPGEFIPTAKAIHSGEALLAVLSLIVWHFYHVHIRSFNRSMFTGYLPMETMQEEHPLELEEAQQTADGVPDAGYHNRRRVYLISYGALSLLLLVGIYLFISFEETAITTVPPQEKVEIFTPNEAQLPEPVSFDAPMTSWEDGIGDFFQLKCVMCHGGVIPLSNLDLRTYDSAILGGTTIPAIVPSKPEGSGVVQRHQNYDHPARLTEDELTSLTLWIKNGAPRE